MSCTVRLIKYILSPLTFILSPCRGRGRGEGVRVFFFFLILTVWLTTEVFALPSYRRLFTAKYQFKVVCELCHEKEGGSSSSDYGKDFLRAGANFMAFSKIEKKDSDHDGFGNIQEILARSDPNDPRSVPDHPGGWLADADKVPLPTKELKKLFPGADAFSAIEGTLSQEQIDLITAKIGGQLAEEDRVPTFYFAIADSKKYAVAQFVSTGEEKARISMAIALDTKAQITAVKVLKSKDKAFQSEAFLKQFVSKTAKDTFQVGVDVTPLPGREKTCQSLATEVKKGLWTMIAVFSKK